MPSPCAASSAALSLGAPSPATPAASETTPTGDGQFAKVLKAQTDKTGPADKNPPATSDTASSPSAASGATAATHADSASHDATDIASLMAALLPALQQAAAGAMNHTVKTTDAADADPKPEAKTTTADPTLIAPVAAPITPSASLQSGTPAAADSSAKRPDSTAILAATGSATTASAAKMEASGKDSGELAKPAGATDFAALVAATRDDVAPAAMSPAAASTAVQATPAGRDAATLSVGTSIGHAGWAADVGDKLTWMVGNQVQRADIVLNPPHLGRIEVSLSLQGDQANAMFVSANPEVRDALQNALPQLRAVLADAGVALGQAHVGAESSGQSAGGRQNADNSSPGGSAVDRVDGGFAPAGGGSLWLAGGRGLVDTFA